MRRTRHRRRFHTDRIVANRRARYKRETSFADQVRPEHLSYGRLASTDPWDCGNPRCGICHYESVERRARRQREARAWRRDWGWK